MAQMTTPLFRQALATAALAVALTFAGGTISHSQQVVALVNGVPITQLDIEQRTKLEQMGGQKTITRQDVLNMLIDEILEVREAKKFEIEVPDSEMQRSYSGVAERMGLDSQKLTEVLNHAGSSEAALKGRLRAQMAWSALVRGRFKASLEIADTDVEAQLHLHDSDDKKDVGYEYTMRPIVFIVPSGSPESAFETRKREADALRARFTDCNVGITFARALNEVAVRDQVIKFSADLPEKSRAIVDGTEVGHLTPPETTSEGVQMFAVCNRRETKNDTPEKKQIRDQIFEKKFGVKAKRYLQEIRSQAMIEYR
ncbi:MAG TPA: SurA N-terminal domain-containing protein [Xanthobacteraceae bacterium]|nr:SurA N-terminal domain-containing protein [Xanthobacteraceae bacterium]